MEVIPIEINKLIINPENDRHGILKDEQEAIDWLLSDSTSKLKALIKDIVEQGEVYEIPLVFKVEGQFIVEDGNRRITAVKLLNHPNLAKDEKVKKFVLNLLKKENFKPLTKIFCRIEDDIEKINEILLRRHGGALGGKGQISWGPFAKENFKERTGKNDGLNLGKEIFEQLKFNGYPVSEKTTSISLLNRLLSNEKFRNRVGITWTNDGLFYTHKKKSVLEGLFKIVEDSSKTKSEGGVTLQDFWNTNSKTSYLDRLEQQGFLPDLGTYLGEKKASFTGKKPQKPKKKKPGPKLKRKALIETDLIQTIPNKTELRRVKGIISELTYELLLDKQPNAIGILVRAVLDFSVNRAVGELGLTSKPKLAGNVVQVAEELEKRKLIDGSYFITLRRMTNQTELISVNTLHQYVHSKNAFPDKEELCKIWDHLEEYIKICLLL